MTEVEQFTPESRLRLEVAVQAMGDEFRQYLASVSEMSGRSSELERMIEASDRLQSAVELFNQRAYDHTGMPPLAIRTIDDAEADWSDDAADPSPAESDGALLSVVSRWDLLIRDPRALLAAGREAHRRMFEDETAEDAQAAVQSLGQALYAIGHEAGEVWLRLDEADMLAGARVFVAMAEPGSELPEDPSELVEWIRAPEGRMDFSEGWVG